MRKKLPIDFGMILFMLAVFGVIAFLFYLRPARKLSEIQEQVNVTNNSASQVFVSDKYKFSFEYPKDWTFFTKEAKENPYTVEFTPVANGAYTLKTFYGELRVYENVDDFEQWLRDNRKETTEENIKDLVNKINSTYGSDYITNKNIQFSESKQTIKDNTAHTLVRNIKCPNDEGCSLEDKPIEYTKWVDIYHDKKVIEFYIATQFESIEAVEINNIVESMEFE